jgi:hypothetical protein
VRRPIPLRRPPRPTVTREQRLAEARAAEDRARRELAYAFARIERTYALAVRSLEEFDVYLGGVRQRLQHAGYIAPAAGRGRTRAA